ncbi:MAG: hypothetical protein KJ041_06945 [Gammaproteobacteria bacterium]|nr:hypothetical protein [Gammaproteobacteria bacterium]
MGFLIATMLVRDPALAAGPACPGGANCTETSSFVATVSDFRTSVSGNDRIATATLRFQNKLTRPLILGYVTGSGVVTDDQGNRYLPGPDSVRGLGAVAGGNVDAKFMLDPGEAADARVEFTWRATKAAVGTTYDLDLTVQEFESLAGGRYKPGRERVLHFSNAGQTAGAAPAAAGAVGAATDPCAGLPRCASGGPFIAQDVSLTTVGGPQDRHHSLKLNLSFRNVSSQPLILGYKSNSSAGIDNLGNAYAFGRPGTHDTSFSGIGLVTSRAADPSFVLNPGEARNAAFTVTRFNSLGKELGSAWSYDVVVNQLEILPSQQVRTGRESSLHFTNLSAGMPAIETGSGSAPADLKKAVDDLKNIFKKK